MGIGFMLILGIILYNLAVEMIEETLNFALSQVNEVSAGQITGPTISGFAGWFLAQIKIPEMLSVVITFIILRWTLTKIPFLKW